MSDRLKDLQRQRALAQEQLAWIDGEIAKETGQAPAPARPFAQPGGTSAKPFAARAPNVPSEAEAARLAEDILARYKDDAASASTNVKRGCLLYFAMVLLLLVVTVAAVYVYKTRPH